jgi:hypothetical protein
MGVSRRRLSIVTRSWAGQAKAVRFLEPSVLRTRLGAQPKPSAAIYQTNEGSHITYVGDGTTGGSLYYGNGIKKGVIMTNNCLLVLYDSNGNYIVIGSSSQSYPAYSCPS